MMGLLDTARQKMAEQHTSDIQKAQLLALIDRFGDRAKTVLANSGDVSAIKEELCQICKLVPSCFLDKNMCGKA